MVLVKNWPFLHLLVFLGNLGKENVFYDILERKTSFLVYEKKNFKKSTNWDFPKGLTYGFRQKLAIYPIFLGNIGQENVSYDFPERKYTFLGYENVYFKNSKNWDFSKGVNPWFWSKMALFSICFFFSGDIGQENVFYDILERKNPFLVYKNKKFKKWTN